MLNILYAGCVRVYAHSLSLSMDTLKNTEMSSSVLREASIDRFTNNIFQEAKDAASVFLLECEKPFIISFRSNVEDLKVARGLKVI